MRTMKNAAALVASCALLLLAACDKHSNDGSVDEPATIVSVAVTPTTASVAIGATVTFQAQAYAASNVAVSSTVTWASSDTSKATVDGAGVVTGVAAGTVTITASSGSIQSNAAALTVTDPALHLTSISVSLASASIAVGETDSVTAVAMDQFGAAMPGVTFTWNSSDPAIATVTDGIATGVAAGTTDITASSGGVTSNAATLTVTAVVGQSLKLLPARLKLTVGDPGRLLVMHAQGEVTWSTSNAAVLTVDDQGQLQALAKGSAVITATSGLGIASSTITVYQTTGVNPDPTSDALIASALAQGTITADEALTYRVFAFFSDDRLPAAFDGAPSTVPDHLLLRELSGRMPALSQATQDLLMPFLIPPVYQESWLAQQAGSKPASAARFAGPAQPNDVTINCFIPQLGIPPVTTAHFNIYPSSRDTFLQGDDDQPTTETVSAFIASVIEEVYQSETVLFTRIPLSDAAEPCNGGNGKVDIYVAPIFGNRAKGVTYAYPGRCEDVPAYILLNENEIFGDLGVARSVPLATKKKEWKSNIAHEFLHVLQFGMNRQASCADYKWFDEATAQWVMDHVEPDTNLEDGGRSLSSPPGFLRANKFFANYLYNDHRVSIEKASPESNPELNGYGDYLFFQFLARTHTPDIISDIYDATETGDSIEAIASALDSKAGGMKTVWPAFAKTLWNDGVNHLLDDWTRLDNYDFGLSTIYSPSDVNRQVVASTKLKPLEIDQKGKPDEIFTLLDNALGGSTSGDYEIQPRSIIYEQLKFTDPTVRTAIFTNPIAGDPDNQYMKVWVVRKVGGVWKAPEDWTEEPIKAFCFDKNDERLDELLVIVSNSEANRNVEVPYRISLRAPMQIATTNVGCWHWHGTASVTTHQVDGPVAVASATVDYYQAPSPFLPDAGLSLGYLLFGSGSGTASYSIEGFDTALGCSVSAVANAAIIPRQNGPVVDFDSTIIVNFGLPDPLHRAVIGNGRTLMTAVPVTFTCNGQTEVDLADQDVQWLEMYQPPELDAPTIGDDGLSFTGGWGWTDEEGHHDALWDLHATPEQ